MKNLVILIFAIILSLLLYESLVVSPRNVLKEEYAVCKYKSHIQFQQSWLNRCHNDKPLDKECLKILEQDYPWEWFGHYKAHIKDKYSEETLDDYNKYKEYSEKIASCMCKTLPAPVAEKIKKEKKERNETCLKEFEIMSNALK